MGYLTPDPRIDADREAVRQIRPDVGKNLTWDEVEVYVTAPEAESWEHIKRHTASPWDAIRKLKGFL